MWVIRLFSKLILLHIFYDLLISVTPEVATRKLTVSEFETYFTILTMNNIHDYNKSYIYIFLIYRDFFTAYIIYCQFCSHFSKKKQLLFR